MTRSEPRKHRDALAKVVRCDACGHVFVWGYYIAPRACPECPDRAGCTTLQNIERTFWFTRKVAIKLAAAARERNLETLPLVIGEHHDHSS